MNIKKYTIGVLGFTLLLTVAAITTAPPASAATTASKKFSPVEQCNRRVTNVINKASTDLEFFKATYYLEPSAAEQAEHYKPVTFKDLPVPVPTAIYKATSAKDPKSRKNQTNYVLLYQRFENTRTYFASLRLANGTPMIKQADIDAFKAANDKITAAITKQIELIDFNKAKLAKTAKPSYDCSKKPDQTAAYNQVVERSGTFTTVVPARYNVRAVSKESRAIYQRLNAQRLKIQNPTLSKQKKTPPSSAIIIN